MDESIRAGVLRGFAPFIRDLGGDPDRLYTQSGLDPDALHDAESMVPLAAVALLLENAARQHRLPTLGLRLGSRQDLSILGLLAVVVQNSDTVYEATANASRYLFFHSPCYELVIEDPSPHLPGCITVRFDVQLERAVPQRQLIDAYLSSTYRMAQTLSPIPLRLRGVSLPHSPVGERSAYRAHFDAPVAFEQPYAAIHLDRDLLQARIQSIKPHLRSQAIAYIATRHPAPGQSLSECVQRTLKSTIGANRGTKAEIADLLNMHPRTLQRRLSDEHATFEDIRADVYRSATRRLLLETELPLSQVAAVLGYSEHSSMTRSVKRWFGVTPAQLRKDGPVAT
ncbi:AraC family transcriptional regulator [Mycobacterium sp. HM-7]